MLNSSTLAERISDDTANSLNTASKARLGRSIVAIKAYLDHIAPAVKSGIHSISRNSSASRANMKTGVTVIYLGIVSCLIYRNRSSAICADDRIRAITLDTSAKIKSAAAAYANRLCTDYHMRNMLCAFDK